MSARCYSGGDAIPVFETSLFKDRDAKICWGPTLHLTFGALSGAMLAQPGDEDLHDLADHAVFFGEPGEALLEDFLWHDQNCGFLRGGRGRHARLIIDQRHFSEKFAASQRRHNNSLFPGTG